MKFGSLAFLSLALSLSVASMATGCALDPHDDGLSDEEAATTSSALDTGINNAELERLTSADLSQAARTIAGGETKGCRTRTQDPLEPNVVHVKLVNCTGRLGRHVVNGEITITFSSNGDGSLHAEHVSQGLTIDGRPAERTASADITFDGDLRRVVRRGVKTGTSRRGEAFTKKTEEVLLVDRATHCRTIDGTGVATFEDGRRVESTVKALRICEAPSGDDYCPTGTVENVNTAKERRVTQRFDGSAVATVDVTGRKGAESKTWSLDCTPIP